MQKINELFNFLFKVKYNYRENISELLSGWPVRLYFIFILCVNILCWALAYHTYNSLKGGLIALHYNVDFGISLLGEPRQVFILPFLGVLVLLINFVILINIHSSRERVFLIHVLLSAALMANLTLLVSAGTIYLINFR